MANLFFQKRSFCLEEKGKEKGGLRKKNGWAAGSSGGRTEDEGGNTELSGFV